MVPTRWPPSLRVGGKTTAEIEEQSKQTAATGLDALNAQPCRSKGYMLSRRRSSGVLLRGVADKSDPKGIVRMINSIKGKTTLQLSEKRGKGRPKLEPGGRGTPNGRDQEGNFVIRYIHRPQRRWGGRI